MTKIKVRYLDSIYHDKHLFGTGYICDHCFCKKEEGFSLYEYNGVIYWSKLIGE